MKSHTAKRIRLAGRILFIAYMVALIYFLFFSERYGRAFTEREYCYNLVPFKEIRRFITYRDKLGFAAVFANLAGNVIGFIPFGLILPVINKKQRSLFRTALLSFEFSLVVETVQLIFKVGSFDVDDLILNTLGGVIGYLLYVVCDRIRRKYYG